MKLIRFCLMRLNVVNMILDLHLILILEQVVLILAILIGEMDFQAGMILAMVDLMIHLVRSLLEVLDNEAENENQIQVKILE